MERMQYLLTQRNRSPLWAWWQLVDQTRRRKYDNMTKYKESTCSGRTCVWHGYTRTAAWPHMIWHTHTNKHMRARTHGHFKGHQLVWLPRRQLAINRRKKMEQNEKEAAICACEGFCSLWDKKKNLVVVSTDLQMPSAVQITFEDISLRFSPIQPIETLSKWDKEIKNDCLLPWFSHFHTLIELSEIAFGVISLNLSFFLSLSLSLSFSLTLLSDVRFYSDSGCCSDL